MRPALVLVLLFLFVTSSSWAQNLRRIAFNDFEKELKSDSMNKYIVNFWATWCKPCVEELPEFEELTQHFRNKNVKVVLVNLDYTSKIDALVMPLLKRKNIQSTVYHLTDTDPNLWIDRVEKNWGGALPATIVFNPLMKTAYFKEGKITFDEIKNIIHKQ